MSANLPFMPLYVGDYFKDTRHLTTEQHGAYLLLLLEYWNRGHALPDDDKTLAMLTGLSPRRWKNCRPVVEKFFICDGVIWQHKRVEIDLSKANEKIEKARKAGLASASARARKAQHRGNRRSTDVQRTLPASSNNHNQKITPLPPNNSRASDAPAPSAGRASARSDGSREAKKVGDILTGIGKSDLTKGKDNT